jgi:transposase
MSSQRYIPEFKDEAVRQVLELGYTVAEVSQRLGVSAYSLYKWVKAARYFAKEPE